MDNRTYDVVIVGSGIIGSSIAYSLMRSDNRLKVAVVEMDPIYTRSPTTLSMANACIQFSLEQNIQISQYAFEVLERLEDTMAIGEDKLNITYRREGNLFLIDEPMRRAAKESLALQKRLGCRVEWWSPEKIKQRFPLYDMTGLVGGTYGPQDGHFDAYAVLTPRPDHWERSTLKARWWGSCPQADVSPGSIWPELAEFVPAFDTLKLVRGWGGLYAVNTLDGNAILGEWPDLKGFFLANGFSGHGLQQAPAVGRYLTEADYRYNNHTGLVDLPARTNPGK